jgi:hypothetical protein
MLGEIGPGELEEVAAIRSRLLEGLAEVEPFAEAVGKTPRTVQLWMQGGMPVRHIGRTPYIPIEEAREWLLSRRLLERQSSPRGPGRPRKNIQPPLIQDKASRKPVATDGPPLDTLSACPPLRMVEQATLNEPRKRTPEIPKIPQATMP